MHSRYRITLAEPDHLHALPPIERAAAALLADFAPAATLADTTPLPELRAAQADQRLWVALEADTPVGFALVEMLAAGAPHLQELDVSPAHTRQGIGTALVRTVLAWSRREGWSPLTLTSFREVLWNAPFYSRRGFAVVSPSAWSSALRSLVDVEHARGLDRAARVVMAYHPSAE